MILMIIFLTAAYGVIILLEVPGMLSRQQWGELGLFFALLVMGFTLALLQIIGVSLPSPIEGITFVVEDVMGLKGQ